MVSARHIGDPTVVIDADSIGAGAAAASAIRSFGLGRIGLPACVVRTTPNVRMAAAIDVTMIEELGHRGCDPTGRQCRWPAAARALAVSAIFAASAESPARSSAALR